jgi:hydrogenase expression/formation protein HypC
VFSPNLRASFTETVPALRGVSQINVASEPVACTGGRPGDIVPGMCLAIPGQVVEIVDEANRLARVDVAGVRRTINIGLLDADGTAVGPGDWVLIHVGFAMSRIDEAEARATRDQLERMGADYEAELEELKASVIE